VVYRQNGDRIVTIDSVTSLHPLTYRPIQFCGVVAARQRHDARLLRAAVAAAAASIVISAAVRRVQRGGLREPREQVSAAQVVRM